MTVSKADNSKPVKNNSGAIKSGGDLSNVVSMSNDTTQHNQTIAGDKFGATFLANQDFVKLSLSNPNNEHYNNQLEDYAVTPSGSFDYLTGLPDGYVTSTNSFIRATGSTPNNISSYWFLVGEPQKFVYISPFGQTTGGSTSDTNPLAMLFATSETLSIPLSDTKKSIGLFSGPVGADNEFYEKTFSVTRYVNDTPSGTTTYNVGAWKKLNLNFSPETYSKVEVTCLNPDGQYSIGVGSGYSQASSLTRTVNVAASTRANPLTYSPSSPTVILVSGEKALQIPCVSSIGLQLMFVEFDADNTKSNVAYYIVPSGSTGTYYPTYSQVAVQENQGRSFSIQVYS